MRVAAPDGNDFFFAGVGVGFASASFDFLAFSYGVTGPDRTDKLNSIQLTQRTFHAIHPALVVSSKTLKGPEKQG
jgi:hypothetical protein